MQEKISAVITGSIFEFDLWGKCFFEGKAHTKKNKNEFLSLEDNVLHRYIYVDRLERVRGLMDFNLILAGRYMRCKDLEMIQAYHNLQQSRRYSARKEGERTEKQSKEALQEGPDKVLHGPENGSGDSWGL